MHYQDYDPVSCQQDSSSSDSSLDFIQKSKNSNFRRSRLPLSPKSSVYSPGRRQSQICGVPLDTQLIPSLRDTIDRMTRPPSRVAAVSTSSQAQSSRETLVDVVAKGDPPGMTDLRSPSFQCNSPVPPNNGSVHSVETIVSPTRLVPKSLKSALRSPKTPKAPKAVTSPPSQDSPALRSVKSILGKKLITPPSSKNQGISSKDIFSTRIENTLPQASSRSRSFTDDAFPQPVKPVASPQTKSTYHHPTSSEVRDVPATPRTRSHLAKSSIPRHSTYKKRSHITHSEPMTEESDIELRFEIENRDRRRLMVANAEVYPSSSSTSGFVSSTEVRASPKSPHTPKQFSSFRRETMWAHRGLGLTLGAQLWSSNESIQPRGLSGLATNNAADASPRSTSHDRLVPESERRQAALLKIVTGLDLERQDPRRSELDADTERDYNGKEGVAVSGSVDALGKRKPEYDDDDSSYEDDFEEDERSLQHLAKGRGLVEDMQCNAHVTEHSNQPPYNQTHGWAISSHSVPRKSPSRTPVIRRSIYPTLLSPAVLKRRSIYIEQPNPTSQDQASIHRNSGDAGMAQGSTHFAEGQPASDQEDGMFETANAIVARARRAFGIPQSESEKFHQNGDQHQRRASLTESEFSSAGSTFWRAARDDAQGDDDLSIAAESLFKNLSEAGNECVEQPHESAYIQRPRSLSSCTTPRMAQPQLETRNTGAEACLRSPIGLQTVKVHPDDVPGSDSQVVDEMALTRHRILRELCDSEETFVARLHVCVQLFILPLRLKNSKAWVDGVPLDIAHFLDWFEDIANLHTHHIVKTLRNVHQSSDVQCISELLLPLIPKLEIYQPYLVRLSSISETVGRMVQEGGSDFGEFVGIQQQAPECGGWGLEAFLLEPMNRLTKYGDIFSRLLTSTSKAHPDYLPTFSVLKSIDVIIWVMTEVKLREDEYDIIKELTGAIQGLPSSLRIATRERRLLCQGQLCLLGECEDDSGFVIEKANIGTQDPQTFKERAGNRMSRLANAVQAWDTLRGSSGSIKSMASSIRSGVSRGSPEAGIDAVVPSFERATIAGTRKLVHLFLFSDVAVLATPIEPGKRKLRIMEEIGLSNVFHAELDPNARENESVPVVLDLIPVDDNLNISTMRLTTLHAKLLLRRAGDDPSSEHQIEHWRSAFQQCSQSTLRLLSYPAVSIANTIRQKCLDPDHLMMPLLESGLLVPKGPSAQAFDVENGCEGDSAHQEREKRGW